MTVVPLHACRCGKVGIPRDLGEMRVFSCEECCNKILATLDRVRPVFHKMVDVGIDHEIASKVMTYLLDQIDGDDE